MFGWWELVGPMPLNKRNTKVFHRVLYGGIMEKVRLLKRNPNMNASVVTNYVLYQCWWTRISKSGQQHDNETMSDHRRTLHIPRCELDRVGVHYINPLDVFVDEQGRYWQNEGDEAIDAKLWENHLDIPCRKTDPL
jgi:hypothetical protein